MTMLFVIFLLTTILAENIHSYHYYDKTFADFVKKYEKNYLSSEKLFRQRVFAYNMDWAETYNSLGHSFTVGSSPFADMTNTEYISSRLCGCNVSIGNHRHDDNRNQYESLKLISEEEVDWRKRGAVTAVQNQGDCGSCWAFSSVGAVESSYFIKNGTLISLSKQMILDCVKECGGCQGGDIPLALEHIKYHGVCTEEEYPYLAKNGKCHSDDCTFKVSIKGFDYLPVNGEVIKAALSKAPLSVGVDSHSPVFQMYVSGVIDSNDCGEDLCHAVLAVGYTKDYWIVKNSFGTAWGEEGYFRVKYDAKGPGICCINCDAKKIIMN